MPIKYKCHFLSSHDINYFKEHFEDREKEDTIHYRDFKDIVLDFRKFNKSLIGEILEKIRKIKDRHNNNSDTEIKFSLNEYFEFLDQISAEQNRLNNEKDPELSKLFYLFLSVNLFELLSYGNSEIPKQNLVDIIREFELTIDIDEFFAPLGKKDNLYYEDFCVLFKYSGKEDILFKSLAEGFLGLNNSNGFSFPVNVSKYK